MNFPPIKWISRHPRVTAWAALALGMVILLVIEASGVGLLPMQWVALVLATVLVAGLCVYIISWEDNNDEERKPTEEANPETKP